MIEFDCLFPGGNIKVHDMTGDTVFVSPDLRDTCHSWFYWAFRVRGAAGRMLTFRFVSDHPVGTRGPAVSTDVRRTWSWPCDRFDDDSFRLRIPSDETYLAFAPMYTEETWRRFLAGLAAIVPPSANPPEEGFIAKSRKGRGVEILHVGAAAGAARHHVVVTARHHACESMASWTLEGIATAVVAGSDADSAWLRENVSFSFVPFMDKDGVEDGDQGKARLPHDHNRDYAEFIYPETAAVSSLVKAITARSGRVDAFIDLHCPWRRGGPNEYVYQVGRIEPRLVAAQASFGDVLEALPAEGALPCLRSDTMLWGEETNVPSSYSNGVGSTMWAENQGTIPFVTTFEVPYANVRDITVTPDLARGLGRNIAVALARCLRAGFTAIA